MDFARVRVRLLSLLLLRTDNYVLLGGDDGDALTASPKSPSPLPPFFCHPPSTIRQNQSMATVRDMPRTVAAGVGDLASSHLCIYRLACCSVSSASCLLSKRPEFGFLPPLGTRVLHICGAALAPDRSRPEEAGAAVMRLDGYLDRGESPWVGHSVHRSNRSNRTPSARLHHVARPPPYIR